MKAFVRIKLLTLFVLRYYLINKQDNNKHIESNKSLLVSNIIVQN